MVTLLYTPSGTLIIRIGMNMNQRNRHLSITLSTCLPPIIPIVNEFTNPLGIEMTRDRA